MRWIALTLVALVAMSVSSVFGRPVSRPDLDGRFRVATFNIHKGADRGDRYDLQRTIRAIADLDADVVGLQEVLRNHAGYGCDDQPSLIVQGLRRLTGEPWVHVYAPAWNTTNRVCVNRGLGDDVETEGLAILARGRILGVRSVRLSAGRIGLAARVDSMPNVSVVVTHLSSGREEQSARMRELAVLLPWSDKSAPAILMGDLNALPDAEELGPVRARYRDLWIEAAGKGLTTGVSTGATRPGRRLARIDYIFFRPEAAPLTLESAAVVDTSRGDDGEVSDHRPVVATFRRNTMSS